MTSNTSRGTTGYDHLHPPTELRLAGILAAAFGLYACNALLQHALAHPAAGSGARSPVLVYGLYLLVTAGIFVTYWLILAMSRRGQLADGRLGVWVIGMAVVLQAGLAVLPPELSEDMLTYVAVGFLGSMPGHNPLAEPASAAHLTTIGPDLSDLRWIPDTVITPYGILWTSIEIGVARLAGGSVSLSLLLLKGVVVAASLLTAFLLGRFVEKVAPHHKQQVILAYLWNPLILTELAGEGHNDALLVLFAVAALVACAFGLTATSVFAQLCGVLTKYVNVLFAPAQMVYLWRTRERGTAQLMLEIAAGALMAGALGIILYAPWWVGLRSFDGTLRQGQPVSSASLFGLINWALRRSPLAPVAGSVTLLLVTIPTLAFVSWASLRVRDAAGLARAFAWIAVVYLLVASPAYWPWYACLPVTLLIAADTQRYLWVIIMLSVVARVVAPLDLFQIQRLLSVQVTKGIMTGLGSLLPLIVLLIWSGRNVWSAPKTSTPSPLEAGSKGSAGLPPRESMPGE